MTVAHKCSKCSEGAAHCTNTRPLYRAGRPIAVPSCSVSHSTWAPTREAVGTNSGCAALVAEALSSEVPVVSSWAPAATHKEASTRPIIHQLPHRMRVRVATALHTESDRGCSQHTQATYERAGDKPARLCTAWLETCVSRAWADMPPRCTDNSVACIMSGASWSPSPWAP